MKIWIVGALLCLTTSVSLAAWWSLNRPGLQAPPGEQVNIQRPTSALPALAPPAPLPSTPLVLASRIEPEAPTEMPSAPQLNVEEAQMLMQLMAEQGDPRSPALGERQPRQAATAAQLADPEQYRAFEEQHSRAQIMAYTGGVKQIPAIRQRIEEEAQAGRRSAEELDEARAALQQLEMLQNKLQREAPELLP